MSMTEELWTATAATCPSAFELRMHGGTEDERILSIAPGKHSVGSGPRCSIRLEPAGVQPMECLIVNDAGGLRVRRWSENVRINGQPFDEAPLAPGDVMSIGPIELEVIALPTDTSNDREFSGEAVTPTWGFDELDIERDSTERPEVAVENETTDHRISKGTARRRTRRVLAYIRRRRQEHADMIARIDELKQSVERAISESSLTTRPETPVSAESPDQSSALAESYERTTALERELGGVREQLATREEELHHARFSIEALERQLIDSQHTMHLFADERTTWEQQFSEFESRLAEYVERIQELERNLDQVCESRVEIAPGAPANEIESTETETAVESSSEIAEAEAPCEPTAEAAELVSQEDVDEPACNLSEIASDEQAVEDSANAAANDFVADIGQQSDDASIADTVSEMIGEADESADESVDIPVDVPVEHASGVSIWREESEAVADDEDSTAPEQSFSEPPSFLDRYAHLFTNDGESTVRPAEAERPQPPVAAAPSEEAHSDEESVEQYMARLLERMRGPLSDTASTQKSTPEVEPTPREEAPVVAEIDTEETEQSPEPITELAELKSRESVPELASDRRAMRELANQSARHALGVHLARKLRRKLRWGLVKATIGGAIGFFLLFKAPEWQSLQFAAGSVAAVASIYWAKQIIGAMIEGFRIGAFDNADESEDEVEQDALSRPPLPIDVDQTNDGYAADEQPIGSRRTEPRHVNVE